MRRLLQRLWKGTDGAVAPTIALSMVGLVAAGGIAFDYAHLVSLDTEMQQAADMAALAAATQLDRADDSDDRAAAAIQDGTAANRLAANFTRFANDGEGFAVEIANVIFCSAFDDSVPDTDTACTETTDGSEARFVIVRTSLRTANYTLTPIVGAFSGTARAEAVAGVETSICNVAPLFVCTGDANFPDEDDIGRGLLLKTGAQNSWAPGNYGYLDFGAGNPGVIDALLGHGLNGCLPANETNTQPGNKNATDAINTRLDVYAGSPETRDPAICNVADGSGCPAPSARKDMIVKLTATENNVVSSTPTISAPSCPADPVAAELQFELPTSPVEGFPRDTCHYGETCSGGNFGNGIWNFASYMATNHPGVDPDTVPAEGSTPTRYEVYLWELEAPSTRLATKAFSTTTSTLRPNGNYNHTITTQCTYSQPKFGRTDYPAQKDRRILPVIAANCEGLNGVGNADEDFQLIRVFDVFITEPSAQRTYPGVTDDKEIYAEVVGPAQTYAGGSGIQYFTRNRPYLIR